MPENSSQNLDFVYVENHEQDYFVEHFKKKTNCAMPRIHMHNSYELYFLLSGDVRYSIGHLLYDVNPGDVVIVPKDTTHRTLHRSEKGLDRILIYFNDRFISSFYDHIGKDSFDAFLKLGCVRLQKPQQDKVQRLFFKMLEAQNYPDSYSQAEIFTHLCEIILIIMRNGFPVQHNISDTTESRILSAVEYIKKNFAQEMTLDSVARDVCMEATYFSKCFKKITGFNFHEFLIQTRLKESEEYLLNSPLPIGKIAEECGFASSNHFGDVFKKYKGMSPREFKKENNLKKKKDKI